MFFCYPRSNGNWRRSVAHLKARWQQFDGVKTIAVAVDDTTDDASLVRDKFADDSIRMQVCANSELQEAQQFSWLLGSVQNYPGITLYAHSKGCTHTQNQSSHLWCDAMASACLDYPELVDCMMRDRMTCGAFRSLQPVGSSPARWHFAGTWWWVRNADLFSRDWSEFERVFWGVESYPGNKFSIGESGCLFFDNAHTAHLYDIDWWKNHIGPAFRDWKIRLSRCGIRPLASNPPNCDLFRKAIA
jgi:hypothetical protein